MQEKISSFFKVAFYGTTGWFESETGSTNCVGVFFGENTVV